MAREEALAWQWDSIFFPWGLERGALSVEPGVRVVHGAVAPFLLFVPLGEQQVIWAELVPHCYPLYSQSPRPLELSTLFSALHWHYPFTQYPHPFHILHPAISHTSHTWNSNTQSSCMFKPSQHPSTATLGAPDSLSPRTASPLSAPLFCPSYSS